MSNDPFAQYATPINQTQPTASADPFAKYATPVAGAVPSEPAAPVSSEAPAPSSDPFARYATPSSPDNGQPPPEPTQHLYQDSSQPWYKRAWDWANTPLLDANLFGLPEDLGLGGFGRGVEHIASGLTSPLSVALTVATLGTGGAIESAGVTALKESGEFTAEELPQILKAGKTAIEASKDLKPIEPAIQEALESGGHDLGLLDRVRKVFSPLNRDAQLAERETQSYLSKVGLSPAEREAFERGEISAAQRQEIATANGGFSDDELGALAKTGETVANAKGTFSPVSDAIREAGQDPDLWKRATDVLVKNRLNEQDLFGRGLLQNAAFQILRHTVPDLTIATTARAAKTANALLNAGFTLQQFESAASMSPRFLDALKEGDYDHALEYGTEAFAGGALGILGAGHALHTAGELFNPILENAKLRPSDEWAAIQRANQEREVLHATSEQMAINLDDHVRYDILGHQKPGILGLPKDVKARQDLELATVLNHIVSSADPERAAHDRNALLEAVGRSDEETPDRPNNGPTPNPDVQALAQTYTKSAGIDRPPHEGLATVDPEAAKKVADAYEAMQHNPDDPKVKASYDALIRETKAQWDAAKAAGYKLEPWTGPGQPYANSAEMAEDVRNNKHLFYFQGGEVPENHPLAQVDPETGETYNNIFRAVHDLFGHAKNGYEFGPRGEENAFLSHSKMYSDEAIPALLSETKGQNSWVNFGKHLRDENGNLPAKGEKGFIPPPERPYAEQKAGILPAEIVNPHLKNPPPEIGEPIAQPSRANTKVLHSNDAGEIRVGSDGRPVVWVTPEEWETLRKVVAPDSQFAGFSLSPDEAKGLEELFPEDSPLRDLISKSRSFSKQNLLTTARLGHPQAIGVVSEELHHTAQRELSAEGEIHSHLSPEQWTRLGAIIPEAWTKHMDSLGYSKDPAIRVLETAAQFMSQRHLDVPGTVDPVEVRHFLSKYHEAVEEKHGSHSNDQFNNINEVSKQHVEDITNERNKRQSVVRGSSAGDSGPGTSGSVQSLSRRLEEGRGGGDSKGGDRGTGGSPEGTGGPEGLRSRELEEFNKLSKLRLRVGMGDSGSAGLVTGDNDVFIGRDHADLIREAGYKAGSKPSEAIYEKFFNDGGVRIRTAGGAVHVDFMEPNADTWDRVYRSIESIPEANRYYVDFRPVKGGTGFNISAYDKDNLLFQLKDLENGGQRPAAPGSVSYFRNGLLSREGEYRDKEPRFPGLASRGSVTWDEIKPHLSDDVVKHDTEEKQNALTAAFNALPDREDYQAAIRAGRAGQLWYERSSRAFDALMDSGSDFLKPKDKTKFLNFVAALSPVQPVRSNLLMALNLWSKWDKAGRPTDVEWKNGVPNKNASLYRILKGRGQTQGVDLPARMNNAVRALQGEPLSGPKVSAFTTNLGTDANRVTNDTWMAVFGDQDPNRINKPAIYDAMSAKVREAAKAEGIAPRQAQAAVWSFIKSLAELSGWGNDRWIPPQEIIKQGLLTPELVGMHSADFADMLQNDPEIREAIRKIGGDLNALDTKLKSYVPGKPATGEAAEANPQLLNAAGRLEAARSNSRIASHLARKQEPSLFDTDFRPNNGLFSKTSELQQQIDSNVFKNQPKEYQDLVLESLRRVASGELSDREQAAAKFLRDEQDKNFEIGSSNDLLHHYIEDYMTRVYKDTNPLGKVITSEAKGGRFATNVSMAKQRVYESNLTALLKSPKQMLLDPVDITAKGRAMLIKAAANRQLIDTLRDKFTRASDGRPAVVLSGQGQVVSGVNGEDPKTFIDPNRVRKINVDPKVVDQLSKSGDLQKYLAEGTIKDITPYVRPNNIGAAIEKLEEQAQRKNAQYDEVGNNKLRTDLMFLKSMQANGDFSGLKAFNDAQEKQYAWDPQDYISLANSALKGWNFVTNSPDGNQVFVRSDIKVHPEFADYLQNRLGLAPSDIAKNPIGKALLGAGTRLKQTLLSLSPFHLVQEALRGILVGVNPFHITGPDILTGEKVDPSDPNSPTIIRKAVEHGFTTGTDYSALQAHSEGLASGGGGLISKIPGVGKVISNSLDWYQNFLFKRYIPALKARSVELMFHEYQRLHPEWSVDHVAKAAALHANDTFGGINWQAMGRSATTQDWGRLLLLAPDWLEAEMRSGARLFNKDEGGLGRAQVAKMALGLWGIARVLNLVTTGNAHYEAPFGLAVKNKEGKETVFSIRTLPTDLLSAAADPVRFITGRLSPTFRAGEELAFGRDQFGRKLQPSDLWADVFRNMAPIPLQSLGQAVSDTGPQIGNVGQAVKALGGTAQTYQTPAGKMAADLASSHSEDGPVDPSQMARHHRVIQLEDQVRAGELSWPDLYKLTYQTDQLHESELKKIQENVKATHDMSPDMASLFSRASRLPAKEFLDLWDVTNPSERAALAPLAIKVQKRYLAKAKKEMTPEERAKDPVFQRLIRMIPPNPMQPKQQ